MSKAETITLSIAITLTTAFFIIHPNPGEGIARGFLWLLDLDPGNR